MALLGLVLSALFLGGNPLLEPGYFARLWSDTDIAWQAYPNKAFVVRSLREGRVPLDNPHILGGMPFAGNPQAQLFYPPTLLFLADVRRGFALSTVAHLTLAFVGAFLLGRHVAGGSPDRVPAGLLAACVYAFSGSMTTQIQQVAISHTSSWIPLFLYCVLARGPLACALATAGLLLSGHTQIASYALLFAALALVLECYRRLRDGERCWWRRLPAAAGGVATGAGLAAVMLLPAAELLSISMRGRGVTAAFAAVNAFRDWHFPMVANPAAFAQLNGDRYWTYPFVGAGTLVLALYALWPRQPARAARGVLALLGLVLVARPALQAFVSATKDLPAFGGFYLGHWDLLVALGQGWVYTQAVIPLLLLLALHLVRPRASLTWGSLSFLALLMTLGPEAPGLGLLARLPVLGEARGAVRFFHVYALMVAVTAAAALAPPAGARRRARPLLALPLVALLLLLLVPWHDRVLTFPFLVSTAGVIVWLGATRGRAEGAARFVPHALILLELFTFGTRIDRVSDPGLYRYADPDAIVPDRDPSARILVLNQNGTPFAFNAGMVRGYDAALGYEPLALRTTTELVNVARPMTVYDGPHGPLADLRDMVQVATSDLISPAGIAVLALLRARYVLSVDDDLLAVDRTVTVDALRPVPARRSFSFGDDRRDCYFLVAPSEASFRLPALEAPTVVRYAVAPDPRLLSSTGWPGATIDLQIVRDGVIVAADRTVIDPADPTTLSFQDRAIELPAGSGEIELRFSAQPTGLALHGFNWIGLTHPTAASHDAGRTAALRARLTEVGRMAMATATGIAAATGELFVYELAATLPPCVAPARVSGRDAAAAMGDATFDPATTLLVEGVADAPLPAARIVACSQDPTTTRISYDAAGPTTLLLTRAGYPGLRARVDDRDVPIRRADIALVAVDVPAGAHELIVDYRPMSYRLGLFVTLLVLGGVVARGAARIGAGARTPPVV